MGRPVEGDYVSRSCPRDGARAAAQARQPLPAQDHGRATRLRRRGRSGGSARLPGRWLDATVSPRRLLVFHSPPPQPGRQLGTAQRGARPAAAGPGRRGRPDGSALLASRQLDAAVPLPLSSFAASQAARHDAAWRPSGRRGGPAGGAAARWLGAAARRAGRCGGSSSAERRGRAGSRVFGSAA